MRDYAQETKKRIAFIQDVLASVQTNGIVYGNSGGKDSALVGILCKKACPRTLGLIMPCGSKRNLNEDRDDAYLVANQYDIEQRVIDLTPVRDELVCQVSLGTTLNPLAKANMAPRLRMTTLYAVAASENRLVAGTGNRSEGYMGYFTKWGDGAYDFNPIADLTVTEILEFLRFLEAPERVINKAPSAGLYDGQTDEDEMGVAYHSIDAFLLAGNTCAHDRSIIDKYHKNSEHKRRMPITYHE
jgi:NAD+ synthase